MSRGEHLVGVISDTHGLARPEALAALPVAVARLRLRDGRARAELILLDV